MTQYNPHIHNRRSIRLKGYDYSQAGLYFITICCKDKMCLFGHIDNVGAKYFSPFPTKQMILNKAGKIANECWLEIPNHFPNVILHEYVIMPNHIHGIIELVNDDHANIKSNQYSNDLTDHGAKNASQFNHDSSSQDSSDNHSPQAENGAKNVSQFNHDSSNQDSSDNHSPQAENGAKNISPLRSPSKTIGSVIRGFKIGVTKWMRQNTNVYDVWQRNYYEHIIQNQQSYFHISEYIKNNPTKWNSDKFYVK